MTAYGNTLPLIQLPSLALFNFLSLSGLRREACSSSLEMIKSLKEDERQWRGGDSFLLMISHGLP